MSVIFRGFDWVLKSWNFSSSSSWIVLITLYFAGKTLEDQGVTHNAKVMVLQLEQSDEETKRKVQEEELQCKKEKEINDKMQRTKKGLEILAERGKLLDLGGGGCSLIFVHPKLHSHRPFNMQECLYHGWISVHTFLGFYLLENWIFKLAKTFFSTIFIQLECYKKTLALWEGYNMNQFFN